MTSQQTTQVEATYAELRSSTTGSLLSPRFGYSVLNKLYDAAFEQGRLNGVSDARKEQRAIKDEIDRKAAKRLSDEKKRSEKIEKDLRDSQRRVRELAAELLAMKRGTVTA